MGEIPHSRRRGVLTSPRTAGVPRRASSIRVSQSRSPSARTLAWAMGTGTVICIAPQPFAKGVRPSRVREGGDLKCCPPQPDLLDLRFHNRVDLPFLEFGRSSGWCERPRSLVDPAFEGRGPDCRTTRCRLRQALARTGHELCDLLPKEIPLGFLHHCIP